MFIFSSLLSMAKERAEFLRDLRAKSQHINNHLIKLLAIDDTYNRDKWRVEIDVALGDLNGTLLKKGREPKWRVIYDNLINYKASGIKGVLMRYAEENSNNSALVYDSYKESCNLIPGIIEDYSKLRLQNFTTILDLDNFKRAVEKRDKSNSTLYSWDELRKV